MLMEETGSAAPLSSLKATVHGILGFLHVIEEKVNTPAVLKHIALCKGNLQGLMSLFDSLLDLQKITESQDVVKAKVNGIMNDLQIVEKKVNSSDVLEYLALCKGVLRLLLFTINSIFDFNEIRTTGKLRLYFTKVELKKTLDDIFQLFSFQSACKSVELKVTVSKEIPTHIYTDENRLKQVLVSLISRALKYSTQGTIKIDVVQDPQQKESLQISVTDTGRVEKDQEKNSKKGESEIIALKNFEIGLKIANFNEIAASLNGKTDNKGIEFTSKSGVGSKYWFRILKDQREKSPLKNRKNVETKESTLKAKKYQSETNKHFKEEEDDHEEGIAGEYEKGPIVPPTINFKLAGHMAFQGKSKKDLDPSSKIHTCPSKIGLTTENSLKSIGSETEILLKDSSVQKNSEAVLTTPSLLKLKSSTQTSRSKPKSVLIVDDNPFNLLIATNYIEELGYFVQTAFSGKEAIEKVKQSKKDGHILKFILMDCQMPVMDGYETSKALNDMMKKKEIPKVPILAWTVLDSGKDVSRCYKSGMVGYLPKPSSQDALLDALSVYDPALIK
jgi:CheY-like chemotaxis protein